ncbi:ac19 [Artaxa digramma nucleopolyhedrovirus]|uniref:Ac19 n=1 Tax=Artaxa digramma nucleopolyhedrovirus TaxID=3070910 RepID=A0AAE6R6D2_9ABAC|nr:ac19 [Euproctis digramma nucleopolyhedrovirus]QHB21776.1 ac19 [Artaxa digramma nucleopolyhedrovirus]
MISRMFIVHDGENIDDRNDDGCGNARSIAFTNFLKSINLSNGNGRKLFYNLCYRFVCTSLCANNASFITLKTVFDAIVEIERLIFSRSRLLHFIVGFLVANSDGNNLQCVINLQLLEYFLTNYQLN